MSECEADDGKGEEKEEEEEVSSTDYAHRDQNLITKVVEIASVAHRTSRLAIEAEQRHRRLVELTATAKAEVDSIREIASSLTETAASAARVALEVCRYSSCQEAFERHSVHCCRLMSLDSFLEVVSNSMGKVDAKATPGGADRTNECMTTVAMVNDDDDDDDDDEVVSMVKGEREGEALRDCSCPKQLGCRSLDVNLKEHVVQRPFPEDGHHNFPSNPDFRSCCFSCISLSDSSLASSGSEARFADRERGSEDERVVLVRQNTSFPKIIPQLQQQSRQDSASRLKGRGCLSELSSDSEVEEILQRKPVESPTVQKLRNLELRTTDALDCSDIITQKRPEKQNRRPVSPLLDISEKDNYAVSGEEVGRNSPKHLFTPPVSAISSAEQINKRLTLS